MALTPLILHIILWTCVGLLVHSYVLYPLIVSWLAKGRALNDLRYSEADDWPLVIVLMAAYNEEQLIEEKLDTLLDQEYPQSKLTIYVGSDASSDQTDEILDRYAQANKQLIFIPFKNRTGKPGIINALAKQALNTSSLNHKGEVLFLMTDASVMLDKAVVKTLARHFKNKEIGMVDAHMHYSGIQKKGISSSENTYLSGEVKLKHNESKAWGRMIGPFGGCFMMRAEYFQPVPSNFLVDDFYLAMKILEQDKLVINDLNALCSEPVTHALADEFRRKKRISAGNFQNLWAFKGLALPFTLTGFAFFSHKVVRWVGPFLMLMILISSLVLASLGSGVGLVLVGLQLIWYIIFPLIDWLLSIAGLHLSILRNIRYFNLMNVALFSGFIKFISGVSTNVWQPTKRS